MTIPVSERVPSQRALEYHRTCPPRTETSKAAGLSSLLPQNSQIVHQSALRRKVGGVQHRLLQIDLLLVRNSRCRPRRADTSPYRAAGSPGRGHWLQGRRRNFRCACVEPAGPSGTTRCATCSPILLHSSMSQVATYLRGWSTLRFSNWKLRLSPPASFKRRLPSAGDFSMPSQ